MVDCVYYRHPVHDPETVVGHRNEWSITLANKVYTETEEIDIVPASGLRMWRVVGNQVCATECYAEIIPDVALVNARPETKAIFSEA